jgi:hypothetical protein
MRRGSQERESWRKSWDGSRLRRLPLPKRPEAEGLKRGRTDAVGAPVHAENESVAPGGDQVAVAVRADTPVLIMLFDVTPDLLEVTDDLPAWAQKEIVGNHRPLTTAVLS